MPIFALRGDILLCPFFVSAFALNPRRIIRRTRLTADLIAFILADNGPTAEIKFEAKVKKLHWEILEWKLRDRLIDERVRAEGGAILEAYELALKRGEMVRVDSEHFMATTMAQNPMSPPRPHESFLDKIIETAGGRRLTDDESGGEAEKNADHIVDEERNRGKRHSGGATFKGNNVIRKSLKFSDRDFEEDAVGTDQAKHSFGQWSELYS